MAIILTITFCIILVVAILPAACAVGDWLGDEVRERLP